MKYIHFRDSARLLWATIAYEVIDNYVMYGTSVISPKEPRHNVSLKESRERACGRCIGAIKWKTFCEMGVDWKDYENKKRFNRPFVRGLYSCVKYFRKAEIKKFGVMPPEKFFKAVKEVKEYFNIVDDAFGVEGRIDALHKTRG